MDLKQNDMNNRLFKLLNLSDNASNELAVNPTKANAERCELMTEKCIEEIKRLNSGLNNQKNNTIFDQTLKR